MRKILAVALAAVAVAPTAWSFCGFYVAQEPGSLFNQSSKVVLVRDGNHTVLTMANDYRGDPEAFGLVVPVPQEIGPGMVKIADSAILAKIDQYTVPRLAEYWDPDPCPEPVADYDLRYEGEPMAMSAPGMARRSAKSAEDFGVTIEQSYSLEEYDIVVVKAETGRGLEEWLRREGYQVPAGSTPVLESYLRQNMHFFLAKIDLSAQRELGVRWPRPLRVEYDSPKFMLPVRLGTLNADGAQDLLIYALTRKGRIETTNYRTARMPTDVLFPEAVSESGRFNALYQRVFDLRVARDGMTSVYLEYAWPLSVVCDPCAAEQLTGAELQALGANWATDYHGGMEGGFVTRLHVRYDAERFPEDLVFQETSDAQPWQVRFVVNHPFTGDRSCREGRQYEVQLLERQSKEVGNLALHAGWTLSDVRELP